MSTTNKLGYLLQHVSFMVARQTDQVLQEQLGIGFSQFKILRVLEWNPSVQQRFIAERLGQTEASISRQIKLMHDDGLIISRPSPKSRRDHITQLTAKGQQLTMAALEILKKYYEPLYEHVGEKRAEQLMELLGVVHEFICINDGACMAPLKQ